MKKIKKGGIPDSTVWEARPFGLVLKKETLTSNHSGCNDTAQ